jgi:hypothetical protein
VRKIEARGGCLSSIATPLCSSPIWRRLLCGSLRFRKLH